MKWLSALVLSLMLAYAPFTSLVAKEKSYSISIKFFKEMEKANLLVEQKQYPEALVVLTELLEKRSSKYEKAQAYSSMGTINYLSNDLNSAIDAYKNVLDFVGDIPLALHIQTLKTLSQLSLVVETYTEARQYSEKIIEIGGDTVKPIDYTLLAQANYKLEDWQRGLDAALQGIELSLAVQKNPDENLLLLLNAFYFELERMENMRQVLEELIKYYPKKSYVLYLASVYGQLDRIDKQTVLMESLYEDGQIVNGAQLRNLASLYMSEKTPYKGALVLEKALNEGQLEATSSNFEMLSQAWRFAAERDKAISTLNEAAKLASNGDNYLQKAYMQFDMARWKEAEESLTKGIGKGLNEKLEGEAWLLLGMARFKMKEYESAIEACENAKNHEKSHKHAQQWISYISSEQRKVETMQQILN